jgi:predicted metal-binding protein
VKFLFTSSQEMAKLSEIAVKHGATVATLSAHDVVVSDWVRFKCRYGCKGYAKHLSCPPYAPTPEETRRMLSEYDHALLLKFVGVPGREGARPEDVPEDFHPWYRDLILMVNRTVHQLEKTAFYDGFYKAFAFGAYPCIYCEHCVAEETEGTVDESIRRKCRHMDLVRPSMEAASMDVFATARKVGWNLRTVPCQNMEYGKITRFDISSIGLLLLE